MTFRLTREQLYDLVWSEPMRHLSRQIGISDVALAKHCRKLGVPVPERGYWNKLQAGQEVKKPTLSPRDLSTASAAEISGGLNASLRARITGEPGVISEDVESIEMLADRFRARLGPVSVPRGFSRAHALIEKCLQKDEQLRQKCANEPHYWHQPHFDSGFERRRLRVLNAIFLGFESVGGSPWLRGEDARELAIYLGDLSFSFELDAVGAKSNLRRTVQSPRDEKARLYLSVPGHTAGVTARWEDQEGCPLEDQIADVIVGMAIVGDHLRRQWVAEQAAWRQKQTEEEERREGERRVEAQRRARERAVALEKAQGDALLADAIAWRDAGTIRAYAAACLAAPFSAVQTEAFENWVRWALAEADRLDPITDGRMLRSICNDDEP